MGKIVNCRGYNARIGFISGSAVGITNDNDLLRDGQRDSLGFGHDNQLGAATFIFLV